MKIDFLYNSILCQVLITRDILWSSMLQSPFCSVTHDPATLEKFAELKTCFKNSFYSETNLSDVSSKFSKVQIMSISSNASVIEWNKNSVEFLEQIVELSERFSSAKPCFCEIWKRWFFGLNCLHASYCVVYL